ncbi:MAG: hypothetical protein KC425_11765 [Anaerolineales bacterium]|nr:hypothetical protein [Anaerolineales bacterium]
MKKVIWITLALALVLLPLAGTLQAQEKTTGAIMGVVYQDVNGDGKCVDTGVAGEGPVGSVNVEFVSSDEKTILTMYSSPDGAFGLFAAGFSYWKLTARPSADWVVTSANPIYAPIDADSPAVSGLIFCVQKASTVRVVLPQSGALGGAGLLAATAVLGTTTLATGLFLQLRRRDDGL